MPDFVFTFLLKVRCLRLSSLLIQTMFVFAVVGRIPFGFAFRAKVRVCVFLYNRCQIVEFVFMLVNSYLCLLSLLSQNAGASLSSLLKMIR